MSPNLTLTPRSNLRLSLHQIPAHGLIPNTSLQQRPLQVYHSVFRFPSPSPSPSSAAASIETHLRTIGIVTPRWRYTIYARTHFHSTTHEVLCISHGRALLCFGGEENPGRVLVEVKKGDAVLVPAGVGHRLMEDREGGLRWWERIRGRAIGICAMGRRGRRGGSKELGNWVGLRGIRCWETRLGLGEMGKMSTLCRDTVDVILGYELENE